MGTEEKHMKMKWSNGLVQRVAILAVALAGAGGARAGLTVIIDAPNPSQVVDLSVTPEAGSGVPSFSGDVYAGIYNETINGVFTPSFCIDVAHDVYIGEPFTDYSVSTLADAPDAPAGPMGSQTAIYIEKLWAAYYNAAAADSSGVTAAALQLAIWVTEGQGQDPGYAVSASGNDSVTDETAIMLAALPGLATEADLEAIVSPDGQSYVIAGPSGYIVTPVPEATTLIAGALLVLPLGASTLRILRRRYIA